MKLLITGSTGMVGRNLCEYLQNDYEILKPTSKELNLLDKNQVIEYLKQNKPDMIIHCAGVVGGIAANIKNPIKFLYENNQIALNIIYGAYELKIKRFLNLASSCMYPKDKSEAITENMILKGELEPTNEGYALAKIISTRLCEYIYKTNNEFLYKTIIPCNLYGKYDKFDIENAHMIPAAINKIHKAKINNLDSVEIWGDGLSKREFMYIDDLCDFVNYAINNYENMPQNLNVGTGVDYTINEYYENITEIVGYKNAFINDTSKPSGMRRKLVDIKLLRDFGWESKVSLKEGILRTYEYYLKEIINE